MRDAALATIRRLRSAFYELVGVVEDAYATVAPPRLLAQAGLVA